MRPLLKRFIYDLAFHSQFGLDVVHSLADCGEFFCIFVRDLDVEFLFDTHDELNDIKGVSAEIFDK